MVVHGNLFAGTEIKAIHCAMKVKDDIRNSKIYQVLNNDNASKPFNSMRIDPLNSKRG